MERIYADIANAYDYYENTEVLRRAVVRHVVTNDEENFVSINLVIKHYLIIDGETVYVPKRYPDLFPTIKAQEGQFVHLVGNDVHFYLETELEELEGVIMGTNCYPVMEFLDNRRTQNIVYNDFIKKVVETSANDGDFDIHRALKYQL